MAGERKLLKKAPSTRSAKVFEMLVGPALQRAYKELLNNPERYKDIHSGLDWKKGVEVLDHLFELPVDERRKRVLYQ